MNHADPDIPTQQVFERVLARTVAAPDLQHARLVHVVWTAPMQGAKLVQFYANGQWVGVSASPAQREAWLILEAGVHHQIELLAVSEKHAATSSQKWLAGVDPLTQPAASARIMRGMTLPVDAWLGVIVDDEPVGATPLFSADTARGGFGAVFGEGGFGYDATPGPGLGMGQLGYGPLGIDADALDWRDPKLTNGPHAVRFTLQDPESSAIANDLERNFTISRLPEPPGHVALGSDLTLTWT